MLTEAVPGSNRNVPIVDLIVAVVTPKSIIVVVAIPAELELGTRLTPSVFMRFRGREPA